MGTKSVSRIPGGVWWILYRLLENSSCPDLWTVCAPYPEFCWLSKLWTSIKWHVFMAHGVYVITIIYTSNISACMRFRQGFTHDFTSGVQARTWGSHMDIPVTHSITYLLECCCVYLVHPKFDLCKFSNNSRLISLLEVAVKWIKVNVNMFAVY